MKAKNIYSIPAGVPFADALTAELLRRTTGRPEELARQRILLPTRRACRVVQEAFLRQSEGTPLLLPRLQPLGDVDVAELFFGGDPELAQAAAMLPPAIDPLHRQILLARLILAADGFAQGPDYALELANALSALLDRVHTENLDLRDLPSLATAELAAHWDITVKFLRIVSEEWPKILDSQGLIDPADRRNRLILALARQWEANPPTTPIIAVGTTGSIPATARLLEVVAQLPQGEIVLPGLDRAIDDESWDVLDDNHPQSTLRQLLTRLDRARGDVADWPHGQLAVDRAVLTREIMRPALTSAAWGMLRNQPEKADAIKVGLAGLQRFDADSGQEEAQLIALYMRQTLETPGRTAALVTPDRGLARRVTVACRRWGLTIDDSGGEPLSETLPGDFLRLCVAAADAQLAPVPLLAMLRHRLCRLNLSRQEMQQLTGQLEMELLRGSQPPAGIEGLHNRLADYERRHGENLPLKDFLERLATAIMPLLQIRKAAPANVLIDAHLQVVEQLTARPADEEEEENALWQGDAGEAAVLFFTNLRERAIYLPALSLQQYGAMLQTMLRGITVRPRWGTHPRLSILGQLEARLVQADLVILGGLNEGTWPPDAGHDPWLSRPMMRQFGLPSPERRIGLSAHDFVQGFSAREVLLTRARRVEGTPTVPARWLQRLDTVLLATGLTPGQLFTPTMAARAALQTRDVAAVVTPYNRPAPTPPVALRPRKLSVTAIETWLHDPYSIYARYILRLRALPPLQEAPDARARGEFLHELLDRFWLAAASGMPPDAEKILRDIGSDLRARRTDAAGYWDFWWPRFERLAAWLVKHEENWRARAAPWASEVKGKIEFAGPNGPFALTARADRIDQMRDGTAALIDYKSAGEFRTGQIAKADLPQLPLEALILAQGGFENLPPAKAGTLQYWKLTGATPPGEVVSFGDGEKDDLPGLLLATVDGLRQLIATFDDPRTPYFSLPRPDRVPRFSDYSQLARVQEWLTLGDGDAEEAA